MSNPTQTVDDKDAFDEPQPPTVQETQLAMVENFINMKRDKYALKTANMYRRQLLKAVKDDVELDAPQDTIISYIGTYSNPATANNYANAIQQLRIFYKLPIDEIKAHREQLFTKIKAKTKKTNKDLSVSLPTYAEITTALKTIHRTTNPRAYFINYLIIYHGLRNKDMNMRFYEQEPREMPDHENIIYKTKNGYILVISQYKTAKRYGIKHIEIRSRPFMNAMKNMNLNNAEYIFKLKMQPWNAKKEANGANTGGQISDSSMNVRAVELSINKLGEGRLFKVVVGHLLKQRTNEKLQQIAKDRGTSAGVISEVYDIKNR
jgi:hypothetical protein